MADTAALNNANLNNNDVTPAALDQANALLAWLNGNVTATWRPVLARELTPTEFDRNLERIAEACGGQGDVIGVFEGGTGALRDAAGMAGEDSLRAVRLLVRARRLIQAGRGRGKALILISDTPVTEADFEGPRTPARGAASSASLPSAGPNGAEATALTRNNGPVVGFSLATDVPGLLKTARDGYVALVGAYNDLVAENIRLEELVAEARHQIALLERQANLNSVTSWT